MPVTADGYEYKLGDEWDWGKTSNKKLREIFSVPEDMPLVSCEQLDLFVEFLLNEIDVNEMVSKFFYYAPTEDIKYFAELYEYLPKEKQDETGTTHSQQDA